MHVSLEWPGTVSLQSDDLNLLVSRHDGHTCILRPDWVGPDHAFILSLSQRANSSHDDIDNSSDRAILAFPFGNFQTNLE